LADLQRLSAVRLRVPGEAEWGGWIGDYEIARWVHFLAMVGIVVFIMVHLALIAIVPRTLRPMVTGRA
jgi:thiosulfate reductase cytochrome b subunit